MWRAIRFKTKHSVRWRPSGKREVVGYLVQVGKVIVFHGLSGDR